jgi:L-iditol 2-dehydrogenase
VKGAHRLPIVCGHEFAGTVDALGDGVDDVRPGDRVAVFPLLWCGRCSACEQGRFVQCENYDYLGSRRDGAFAESVVAPRRNLVRIPDGVSLEVAAMTEPAAVALHALRRAGGCSVGETVAVFGCGPIGLMVAQWARAMGAAQALLFDVVGEKLELARRLGFDTAFDSRSEDPVAVVERRTGGRGAHLCIEAAGVPATMVHAIQSARRGGRVVLLGNPSGDATLPAALLSQFMRREGTLVGTWNSGFSAAGNDDDWRAALESMASGALDLEPLISHRVSLDDAAEVLRAMNERRGFFSKVLVAP